MVSNDVSPASSAAGSEASASSADPPSGTIAMVLSVLPGAL